MFDVGPQELDELALTVEELRDEVRVLRQVLDEMREAVMWWNQNAAHVLGGEIPLPTRPLRCQDAAEIAGDSPRPASKKQQSFLEHDPDCLGGPNPCRESCK